MNDILKVIFSSIFSIAALFLLTKLMGRRQISQLSLFDYINGITIGSITAEMATELEKDVWLPLTAMVIYALSSVLLSFWSDKSLAARRVISGCAEVLLEKDTLIRPAFKRTRIDLNEFLTQCRSAGYFDISQLETAIAEPNGIISFLPKAPFRPLTPKDMTLKVAAEGRVHNVIMDGNMMQSALTAAAVNEKWLLGELRAKGINDVKDVFLATVDISNTLRIY